MRPRLFVPVFAGLAIAPAALAAESASNVDGMRADEIRAMVSEMVADAESRSSLLQSGGTAGHNGHFFLSSADGNNTLEFEGQVQFRYYLNFRDSAPGIDDFTPGFQTRRTKLGFGGDLFGDMFYKIKGEFSRSSGAFGLEEAYAGMDLGDGWKVRWGQFKEAFLREENMSSSRQLLVDRSVVNELFNQDFSQALEFAYSSDQWRFLGSFSDGFGAKNSDLGASPADWSFNARFEYLVSGDWKQFKDFTSARGSDQAIMIGAAAHYEIGPDIGTDEQKLLTYTIDASWEDNGWNAFAYFVGRNIKDAGGVSGVDIDDYGFVIQGGVYVAEDWELFARYDIFINDSAVGDDFSTISFGANNYIHGHAAKFTIDANYYLNDTAGTGGAVGASTGIGLLGNGANDGEFVVRAQFQLLF
ncbi:MAG: hypothetical protein H6813_04660 [Phycisphaeraceae bacterium]|nr:hypothetical protein [Phycisphaeraceae bacterium]MCB9847241.1 hypothetical protein [Phycisphaeraceae bacterium]